MSSLVSIFKPTIFRYWDSGLSLPIVYCSTAVNRFFEASISLAASGYPSWYFRRSSTIIANGVCTSGEKSRPIFLKNVWQAFSGSTCYLIQASNFNTWQVSYFRNQTYRFPKLWGVASNIHVSNNRLWRWKYIESRCPESCRHNDLFTHKNPWKKWIKRNLHQKVRVCRKVTSCYKWSKSWYFIMGLIVTLL